MKKLFLIAALFLAASISALACDTSPTLTAGTATDNGDGTFDFDLTVCIGDTGSEDGFDITMSGGLKITATSDATINNGGNSASASISGPGVLTYTYGGFPSTWFEPDPSSNPCFTFTLTVDGNPTGQTVSATGLNDGSSCSIGATTTWSSGPIAGPPPPPPGCGGMFYDTGGSSANYSVGENYTVTICPDFPGEMVSVTFSVFELENNYDYMYIYDNDQASGGSTSYTGTNSPGTVTATNSTGCLTFEFIEDGFCCTRDGWEASVTCETTVPIELISLNVEADKEQGINVIKWVTGNEINNDKFIVEKNVDLNDLEGWEVIGEIEGKEYASTKNEYAIIDRYVEPINNYYRLIQQDKDGKKRVYTVTKVNNTHFVSKGFYTFPNPASNVFYIKANMNTLQEGENISYTLYNNVGKEMLKGEKTQEVSGELSVSTTELENGVYFLKINSNGVNTTRRIVISK